MYTHALSNMGYMELKRHHQHLVSEIEAMEERSRETETKHFKQVHDLIEEISQSKVSNLIASLCVHATSHW